MAQNEIIFSGSALKDDLSRDAAGVRKTKLIRTICCCIWLHVLSLDLKQIKQKTFELFYSNLTKSLKFQNVLLYISIAFGDSIHIHRYST